jgi:hypothetical protein
LRPRRRGARSRRPVGAAVPLTARDERFDPPTPSLTIVVDRRLLPGEDLDEVVAAMASLVAETVRKPFRAEVRVVKAWPPCATPPDQLFSRAAVAAGIPAILLGPGDPIEAHATDESLAIGQFRQAIDNYAALCLAASELPPATCMALTGRAAIGQEYSCARNARHVA